MKICKWCEQPIDPDAEESHAMTCPVIIAAFGPATETAGGDHRAKGYTRGYIKSVKPKAHHNGARRKAHNESTSMD